MSELTVPAVTPPAVQPAPPRRRRIPGETGIWVFVLGDMVMFAAFFGIYVQARSQHTELFNASQQKLLIAFGAVNTCLLLTGSLFVVWGVHAIRNGAARLAPKLFAAAFVCASLFGLDKVIEYTEKLSVGITPVTNPFFTYFFMFTGIHALHLIIGMCVLARMRRIARQPELDASDMAAIESGATYWHLVDLLWVVLFALLYLLN